MGWNWDRAVHSATLSSMDVTDIFWSNGQKFEAGGEMSEEDANAYIDELGEDETGLDFEGAMAIVDDGLAVCRFASCKRVIFKKGSDRHVGSASEDSLCTSKGLYEPSEDDQSAKDWMIDAHQTGPADQS